MKTVKRLFLQSRKVGSKTNTFMHKTKIVLKTAPSAIDMHALHSPRIACIKLKAFVCCSKLWI